MNWCMSQFHTKWNSILVRRTKYPEQILLLKLFGLCEIGIILVITKGTKYSCIQADIVASTKICIHARLRCHKRGKAKQKHIHIVKHSSHFHTKEISVISRGFVNHPHGTAFRTLMEWQRHQLRSKFQYIHIRTRFVYFYFTMMMITMPLKPTPNFKQSMPRIKTSYVCSSFYMCFHIMYILNMYAPRVHIRFPLLHLRLLCLHKFHLITHSAVDIFNQNLIQKAEEERNKPSK